MRRAALLALGSIAWIASCDPVVAERRSIAPKNASATYPCADYETGTSVKAQPREGRCEVPGRPAFDFTIVVDVPETSIYAAGHSFVMRRSNLDEPPTSPRCAPPCLTLPAVGNVIGEYQVTSVVAQAVGYPLPDGTLLPVRARYLPAGFDARTPYDPSLPLDVLFASSRLVPLGGADAVATIRSLPVGSWTRVFEPEAPFDAYFPPRIDQVGLERGDQVFDVVALGGSNVRLDDPGGTSRDAVVRRAEGLDGFRLWLADPATGRRVSTVKTLSGTEATPRLETTGLGTSLDGVEAVVAPPEGTIALPTLRTSLPGGAGLTSLDYPTLPLPLAIEGLVAVPTDGGSLISVAARVTFTSDKIARADDPEATPLLEYATTVSTDDRGRFATVLPPGTYDVTVAPSEGTGFAIHTEQLVIDGAAPITLTPPRRTKVRGRAELSDGRPLASAEILAQPEPGAGPTGPRPARARVDESGAFALELDQGPYILTAIPEDGTGFPRLVSRTSIPPITTDLGTLRVVPPTSLKLQFREPSALANPIVDARVRIFAAPVRLTSSDGSAVPLLEVGTGMTDAEGKVEILLAQQPQ